MTDAGTEGLSEPRAKDLHIHSYEVSIEQNSYLQRASQSTLKMPRLGPYLPRQERKL